MEWRLFILSSIVDSLAWPTAAVIIALVFRRPLLERLPSLDALRFRGFDTTFRAELEQVFERLDSTDETDSAETSSEWAFANRLASVEPTAAVKEAWHLVDFTAARIDVDAPSTMSPLTPGLRAALRQLRSLRDRAMQAPTSALTVDAAEDYVEAAYALSLQLSQPVPSAAQSAHR